MIEILEICPLPAGKIKVIQENKEFLVLYKKEWQALGVKKEETVAIEEAVWEEAAKQVLIRGKKRIFHLLGTKDYTSWQIRQKLSKGGYDDKRIEAILAYFHDLGYIDDQRYLEQFYRFKKDQYSQRQLKAKLMQKGIGSQMLRDFFASVDQLEEEEAAKRILHKRYAHKDPNSLDREKMYAYLVRKGFNYGMASETVRAFLRQIE